MSKIIDVKIKCPNCGKVKKISLYRSIWGEYEENRNLVMNDEINIFKCPKCKQEIKVPFSLFYTNANLLFAVWWEPNNDENIDRDIELYKNTVGVNHYLTTAPRIKDWNEFKEYILYKERGN